MGVALWTAVGTPELIGVLGWWALVAVSPLLLLRRWRRRRVARERHRGTGGAAEEVCANAAAGRARVLLAAGDDRGEGPRGAELARVSRRTLEPLCRQVDFRRRIELAVAELERRLSVLPRDRWRVEPYPLSGERRNTLLVLGETGVFVISATLAPGHWNDLVTVNGLGRKIGALLPGYLGDVHPAICHPFSSLRPRIWHRDVGSGEWIAGWLVGGDSVIDWIEQFGTEHGLGPGDLEWFDVLSKPNWLRPAIQAPPTWPPVPDGARSGPRG